MSRILIIGASGSGTSTLGRALSTESGIPHVETDDLFWIPSDPPYVQYHDDVELAKKVNEKLISEENWILTGSPCGWGDQIIPILDLVVFITVPTEVRIERIKQREAERFGARILEGRDLYEGHQRFLEWTAKYDMGGITGRSKPQHEHWLTLVSCPVLRVDGLADTREIVSTIIQKMA